MKHLFVLFSIIILSLQLNAQNCRNFHAVNYSGDSVLDCSGEIDGTDFSCCDFINEGNSCENPRVLESDVSQLLKIQFSESLNIKRDYVLKLNM